MFYNFKKILVITLYLLVFDFSSIQAQVVYQDVSNKAIYEFLDELANIHLITINSVIKPYTRRFIAEKLQEAKLQEAKLNLRQSKELYFYLRDYNKELIVGKYSNKRFDIFYHSDSLFTLSINGILGAQAWSNENGTNYHRWFGAEAFSYVGNLGVYASLRDNTEKIPLADTGYINLRNGGKYRKGDYSEMRGGLTYSWKWGHVALVKDYIEWGNSYRYPNIISTKAPSFAQLKLQITPVEWFEFNYVHGWLVSEVVDSSRSYNYNGVQRNVFHSKYIAANMFTFKPWKRLNFSFGNSIIYSDQYLNPAYFIPVFFYKSVDHTYNAATNVAGQNSQMFFDISSRLVPKTHMYYSMFIDVLSFGTVFDKEQHANHWSMLGGIRVSNLIANMNFTIEYIRNHPLVYKNDNITTLYNSNWYNMGHYLKDNAQEIYVAIDFKPVKKLLVKTWYSLAQKGPNTPYIRDKEYVLGQNFMGSVEWEQVELGISVNYQVTNDFFVFSDVRKGVRSGDYKRYNSAYYQGNTLTYSLGMNFGF